MNLPFPIFHTVCVCGSRKTRTHSKHSLYLILVAVHLIVLNKMCSCFWLRSFSLLLAPCDQFYIHLCHRKLHIIFFLVYTYFHLVLYISLSFSIPMSFHVRLLSVRTHTHTHNTTIIFFTGSRKLLQASIRANKTGHFIWVASDSWGAKSHPVREQEYAAVNTITVLPQRTNLDGKFILREYYFVYVQRL